VLLPGAQPAADGSGRDLASTASTGRVAGESARQPHRGCPQRVRRWVMVPGSTMPVAAMAASSAAIFSASAWWPAARHRLGYRSIPRLALHVEPETVRRSARNRSRRACLLRYSRGRTGVDHLLQGVASSTPHRADLCRIRLAAGQTCLRPPRASPPGSTAVSRPLRSPSGPGTASLSCSRCTPSASTARTGSPSAASRRRYATPARLRRGIPHGPEANG